MTVVARPGLLCPPRVLHVPPHAGSYADEVCGLAETVGIGVDADQRVAVEAATVHDERGDLVVVELGVSAPRQNVKTHTAKALALADLVLFREPECLWTAHLRETSDDAFRNAYGTGLADLFDSYDDLRRLVARNGITDSDGEKSIQLRPLRAGEPTPTLTFRTRSERGGRGLSGRRVTFDEALFLKPVMTAAMIPVLSAQSASGSVQVRYLGSPGLAGSGPWREIRDRGRSGREPALAWVEWGADRESCELPDCSHAVDTPGCALDREHLVRAANLAIAHGRMHPRFVMHTERRALTPEDYMRERLGWWIDPPALGGELDVQRWAGQVDRKAARGERVVWGVDLDEARQVHLAVGWVRPDGAVQVMLPEPEDEDRARVSALSVPQRLGELVAKWGGRVVLGGPAAALLEDLSDELDVTVMTGAEFTAACGTFDDLLTGRRIWHAQQDELDVAVGSACWRSAGADGARAFRLRNAPAIGPLAAVVRAVHGLLSAPAVDVEETIW